MAITLAQVHAKAKAFVDALGKLPRSQYTAVPSEEFGRDYNALRTLALEMLPGLDQRLLGPPVTFRTGPAGGEVCSAHFVEIETYSREILELLGAKMSEPKMRVPSSPPGAPTGSRQKAYDVSQIRKQHSQAYAPWTEEDDKFLRTRFHEGASVDDLALEFSRQPGAIRSRLRKLGLDPTLPHNKSAPPASASSVEDEQGNFEHDWRFERPNAGRPWSQEDDSVLLREFEAGTDLGIVAKLLGRGVFSIEVRLSKLGRTPFKS